MKNIVEAISLIFLITSCAQKYSNNNTRDYYIMKISKNDIYHGKIPSLYLLNNIEEKSIVFDQKLINKMEILPIIAPRYPLEYYACCEYGDMVYAQYALNLNDSIENKFNRSYDKIYQNDTLKLKEAGSLRFYREYNETNFSINLYKVNALLSKCKAANNNPGSSYTDSVVNFKQINKFKYFDKYEKYFFEKNLDSLLNNKIIAESFSLISGSKIVDDKVEYISI